MRNVRKLLVGTAVAGALATGIFAAPAASAATSSTTGAATAASSHWKSFDFGGGHHGRIGYEWGRDNGRYWIDFKLWDRDSHDRSSTYIDIEYHRNGRWHHYKQYSTKSFYDRAGRLVFPAGADNIRFRGGYGWSNHYGWNSYHNFR